MQFDRAKFIGLRVTHKFTQDEFADKMGVSRTTLAKWEGGKAEPSLKQITAAAGHFGVAPEDLIARS